MQVNSENLKSIVEQGREMAKAGHFDSAGILKKVDDFDRRYVLNVSIRKSLKSFLLEDRENTCQLQKRYLGDPCVMGL